MIKEAVILAGGLATRMGNDRFPKWLTSIGKDMTIAYCQLNWLQRQGIEKVYITINKGFRPLGLSWGWKHQIIFESEPCGDEGGLKKALEHVETDDILVVNCDILTDLDLSKLPPAPALVVVHPRAPWGVFQEIVTPLFSIGPGYDVKCTLEEKPILPIFVSSGIYLFPRSIKKELVDNGILAQNIIPKLLKEGRLNIHKYGGLWHSIETPKDIEVARELIEKGNLF